MTKSFVLLGFALAALGGCSVAVRDADHYRDDVNKLLETKSADVKACYDGLLQGKTDLAGNVNVHFTVEVKTGALTEITTDGPAELGSCVSNALNGLVLSPPDDGHSGDATFVYAFTVGAPAAS